MKTLIVVRHGQSLGNAFGVIQGNNSGGGLTDVGKQQIISNTNKNIELLKQAEKIVTSPYLRAFETAKEISKISGLNVTIDDRLHEMDAGILAGLPKIEAENKYPEYYKIWKNRLDLDGIPNAEKGAHLQARILAFLLNYYEKEDFCDVLVTHAGFIRCLINTIEGRQRTNQFNIDNGAFFKLDDIFKMINIEQRKRAMNSRVFIIDTLDGKYVAKIKQGKITKQDESEKQLLDQLPFNNIPTILTMQSFDNGNYCKILKYVKGVHKYGKLNDSEYTALINSEIFLENLFSRVKNGSFRTIDLIEKLEDILNTTKNDYVKSEVENLLKSPERVLIQDKQKYVLSHDDMNRDNILFEEQEDGSVRANIIDFESLEYAPKDYQFASMLASGLLLEGETMARITETIKMRNKNIDLILYLMQIRLIEGLHFFIDKSNAYVQANKEMTMDLSKKYYFAYEILKKEKSKSKGEEQSYDN